MHTRLYRHALESIFAHLDLHELGRVSIVCRDWAAAVQSMRPIGACVTAAWPIADSRVMMRHVSWIDSNEPLLTTTVASLVGVIRDGLE